MEEVSIRRITYGLCFKVSLSICLFLGASSASGQTIAPLVPLALDPTYNRGRNVAVDEQLPSDYQPLGLRLGSITAYPSFGVVSGATNNVYATDAFKRSDAFYFFRPGIRVSTDFPKHQVNLVATASIDRYAHESIRNQNAFSIAGSGRLDMGETLRVTGQVLYSRSTETPYVSDLSSDVSVLSVGKRFNPSIVAVYAGSSDRVRGTIKIERLDLSFSDVKFADGATRVQSDRDRKVDRATAQAEYALSPSFAAFAQATLERTRYDEPFRIDGRPNRDGKSTSFLGGLNFDLAGLMRGSIGLGYQSRNYTSLVYTDRGGLIAQVQGEFFFSPLTTAGVSGQRTTQDSGSSFAGAYTDTRLNIFVNHALLRNLFLNANLLLIRQKLIDNPASSRRALASVSARYHSNRSITVAGTFEYGRARPGSIPLGIKFSEMRGEVSVTFRR